MKRLHWVVISWLLMLGVAQAEVVQVQSRHAFDQTVANLKQVLDAKGITIFSEVDHAKGAQKVGLALMPNKVLIFGNPKVGTKLMHCDAKMGMVLPLKILINEDLNHKVWLSYLTPLSYRDEFALQDCELVLKKITHVMKKIVDLSAM